jgi:hypothetical protein
MTRNHDGKLVRPTGMTYGALISVWRKTGRQVSICTRGADWNRSQSGPNGSLKLAAMQGKRCLKEHRLPTEVRDEVLLEPGYDLCPPEDNRAARSSAQLLGLTSQRPSVRELEKVQFRVISDRNHRPETRFDPLGFEGGFAQGALIRRIEAVAAGH